MTWQYAARKTEDAEDTVKLANECIQDLIKLVAGINKHIEEHPDCEHIKHVCEQAWGAEEK